MMLERCTPRILKVVLAAAGIAGVALAIACLYRSGPPPVQTEAASVPRMDERPRSLGDGPLVGEVRSADDVRSGPVPPVVFVVGRPDPDNTPDLSTPAQAVYSVLELLDRSDMEALSQCFHHGVPPANERPYPRCLGPPIELVDVAEEDDAAKVVWNATVHTAFSPDGKSRAQGETVTLTTRLVRIDGLWKLVRLHDGDD